VAAKDEVVDVPENDPEKDPENDPVIPWVTIREPVMLVDCN
jgi:hypothetical protein